MTHHNGNTVIGTTLVDHGLKSPASLSHHHHHHSGEGVVDSSRHHNSGAASVTSDENPNDYHNMSPEDVAMEQEEDQDIMDDEFITDEETEASSDKIVLAMALVRSVVDHNKNNTKKNSSVNNNALPSDNALSSSSKKRRRSSRQAGSKRKEAGDTGASSAASGSASAPACASGNHQQHNRCALPGSAIAAPPRGGRRPPQPQRKQQHPPAAPLLLHPAAPSSSPPPVFVTLSPNSSVPNPLSNIVPSYIQQQPTKATTAKATTTTRTTTTKATSRTTKAKSTKAAAKRKHVQTSAAPKQTTTTTSFPISTVPCPLLPVEDHTPSALTAENPLVTSISETVVDPVTNSKRSVAISIPPQTTTIEQVPTLEEEHHEQQPSSESRTRAFSMDLDPSFLDSMITAHQENDSSSDAEKSGGRNRAFSFECFAFGINAEEPLPPPLYQDDPQQQEQEAAADVSASNDNHDTNTRRPRGDSIIFDPVSFQDGGIHEKTATLLATARSTTTRARKLSVDLDILLSNDDAGMDDCNPPLTLSSIDDDGNHHPDNSDRNSNNITVLSHPGAEFVTTASALTRNDGTSTNLNTMVTLPSGLHDGITTTITMTTSGETTTGGTTASGGTTTTATFSMELLNKDGRIGIYLPDARRARIERFHSKRKMRIWRKRIKYDCRKKLADSRPRIKGRFVKRVDMDD